MLDNITGAGVIALLGTILFVGGLGIIIGFLLNNQRTKKRYWGKSIDVLEAGVIYFQVPIPPTFLFLRKEYIPGKTKRETKIYFIGDIERTMFPEAFLVAEKKGKDRYVVSEYKPLDVPPDLDLGPIPVPTEDAEE